MSFWQLIVLILIKLLSMSNTSMSLEIPFFKFDLSFVLTRSKYNLWFAANAVTIWSAGVPLKILYEFFILFPSIEI